MTTTSKRIWISLTLYVAWIVVTMLGAKLVVGGEVALDELISHGIGWHFAAAIALLFGAILAFGWRDMHFTKPHSLIRVMWFPAIYLLVFAGVIAIVGVPPLGVFALVAVNTLMVGISEEVMFRGVLFRAFDRAMSIWPAIILTSVLFGAVHALNVFITGDLSAALIQSVAAGMSGLIFMAILLRTGSILPAIAYHFAWDFLLFIIGVEIRENGSGGAPENIGTFAVVFPLLLNLPNVIFALIMLRNIGRDRAKFKRA